MVALQLLKHTCNVSDEEVVATWVENPYWQYFCGEQYFCHESPIDPSLMTGFRKRIGQAGLRIHPWPDSERGLGHQDSGKVFTRRGQRGHHGAGQGGHLPHGCPLVAQGAHGAGAAFTVNGKRFIHHALGRGCQLGGERTKVGLSDLECEVGVVFPSSSAPYIGRASRSASVRRTPVLGQYR